MEGTVGSPSAEQEEQREEHNEVPEKVKSLIDQPEALLQYMTETNDACKVLNPIAWEVTGLLMTHLKEKTIGDDLPIYEKCFAKIAEFSSPKNLYLGILEHFDPSTEAKYVELLIPALSVIVNRLYQEDMKTCSVVLQTTYSTVSYYVDSLNLPEYKTFDPLQKREKVFEAIKIEGFMVKMLHTLRTTIEKLSDNLVRDSEEFADFRSHTFQYICSSLVILGQLDLEVGDAGVAVVENGIDVRGTDAATPEGGVLNTKHENHLSTLAADTMQLFERIYTPSVLWNCTNWDSLHPSGERSEEGKVEMEKHAERAKACYLYLLFNKHVLLDSFPSVYSQQWLLVKSMVSLLTLLGCENQCVVWKGLGLLKHILDQTNECSLTYVEVEFQVVNTCNSTQEEVLTAHPVKAVFQHLKNVAVYMSSKSVRMLAIRQITQFLDKFVWADRYLLLFHLLGSTDHAGLLGLFIGYVKDKLNVILQENPPKGHEQFFNKKKMTNLGEVIFSLSDGAETDLLADSDRIMPALNLLRFILIRDKENLTGVGDHISRIEKEFLKPLRTGIDISRAHYENELRKYGKKRTVPEKNADGEPEFSVNGIPLPSLPLKEQRGTLEAALHSFDMMEIVAIRVGELITK